MVAIHIKMVMQSKIITNGTTLATIEQVGIEDTTNVNKTLLNITIIIKDIEMVVYQRNTVLSIKTIDFTIQTIHIETDGLMVIVTVE